MSDPADIRDAPGLVVKVLRQISTLIQDEMALARAEISLRAGRAGTGLAIVGCAFAFAMVAMQLVAAAAVAGLVGAGMELWLAALSVAAILALIALILAVIGRARLSSDALVPRRSLDNLASDAETLREAGHV